MLFFIYLAIFYLSFVFYVLFVFSIVFGMKCFNGKLMLLNGLFNFIFLYIFSELILLLKVVDSLRKIEGVYFW